MSDRLLDVAFSDLLVEAGFTPGPILPDSSLYTTDLPLDRDPAQRWSVMLVIASDSFVLQTFIAPLSQYSAESIDAARDDADGYSRTSLNESWVLGGRIDSGLMADLPG
jgi:hypothetical protein